MSAADRYALALRADDLTSSAKVEVAPADVLAAAGMAGQRYGLGMLLQRLRAAPHVAERRTAETILAAAVKAAVRRREIRREGHDALDVARAALEWWLDPNCPACTGLAYQAANGRLLDKRCATCAGTGRQPAPEGEAARWLIGRMDLQVSLSEASHRRLLR